jgi:hypothetical protein
VQRSLFAVHIELVTRIVVFHEPVHVHHPLGLFKLNH